MRISDLENRRVAIWGLGREGHAAHDVLRRRIPDIELAIFCSEAEAKFLGSGNALDRYITRKPTAADLAAFDVIIKSPGISAYLPELLEAVVSHLPEGTPRTDDGVDDDIADHQADDAAPEASAADAPAPTIATAMSPILANPIRRDTIQHQSVLETALPCWKRRSANLGGMRTAPDLAGRGP